MTDGADARAQWVFVAPPPREPGSLRPRLDPPSFSVVIPVRGVTPTLAEAVESVLAQTSPALEVIVVSDGSPDDVSVVLGSSPAQVRFIDVDHGGVSRARNVGAREARGEFVAFLDADDVYEPDFLAALGALATERPDLDVLTTDSSFVVDGAVAGTFHGANAFPTLDQRGEILARCYLTVMSAVRRGKLLEIGGFDETMTYGEDWDFWLRVVLAGGAIGMVDAPLSRYRMGPDQATARRAASLRGRARVLDKTLRSGALTQRERAAVVRTAREIRARAAIESAVAAGSGVAARGAWFSVVLRARSHRRWRRIAMLGVVAPVRAQERARRAGLVSSWSRRRTTPADARS